jgi:hypothetical protein
MKIRIITALVFTLFASALHAQTTFATGLDVPESITQTASGNFFVTDADGTIWNVPASGGSASSLATVTYSLRGGLILPPSFGSLSGRFLVVGGDANVGGMAFASTLDTAVSPATVSLYASQSKSLWTEPVLAPKFGSFSGDILVTNQGDGTGTFNGAVDFFTPANVVGNVVTLSQVNVPFGAALAPTSFADVGGTLLVSDAVGSGIYSVDNLGNVRLFTTIPLNAGQSGLRQIAFAPRGFGRFAGDLFVSVANGVIDVVNRDGTVIGAISGAFNPRGLLFTNISGSLVLLLSDTRNGKILRAGPADVVSVPH